MTRAQFAAFSSRALKLPDSQSSFSDVPKTYELYPEISKAVGAGIVIGRKDGTFGPEDNVTRQEIGIMVDRALQYKGIVGTVSELTFMDTNQIYAKEAISRVKSLGIIKGYDDNTFRPDVSSTRGVAAAFINRMLQALLPKQPVIVIDPGHGGKFPGNTSLDGVLEKTTTLDVGLRVKELFKRTPYSIFMTRDCDTELDSDRTTDLSKRTDMAKNKKADVFVSIHTNSSDGNGNGSETYYYGGDSTSKSVNPCVDDSKLLASYIQRNLVSKLNLKDRGIKDGDLYVLRENGTAAALTELGFSDNKNDNAIFSSEAGKEKAAEAIYNGILCYLQSKGYDTTAYRL